MTEPKIFKHGGDGNWRCRSQDAKGRWRTAKFITGTHEPGHGDEPPPITASGAFVRIPKAIRDTIAPKVEPAPEPQAQTPVAPQIEPTQSPQAEPAQTEPAKETSGFPPLCADAMSAGNIAAVAPPEMTQVDGMPPQSEAGTPNALEIPLVEMAVDTLFNFGEQFGGPKAPKASATEGFSAEQLRDTMVKAAKEVFPKADVEMGPAPTLVLSILAYGGLCYAHEDFRKNTAPWYLKLKTKFAGWWFRVKSGREARRRAKAAAQTQTEEEGNQDA